MSCLHCVWAGRMHAVNQCYTINAMCITPSCSLSCLGLLWQLRVGRILDIHCLHHCNHLRRMLLRQPGKLAAGPPSPTKGSGSPGGGEVTEEALAQREEDGAASICEVYAALLLGFLAEADSALRQARPVLGHCLFGICRKGGYVAWSLASWPRPTPLCGRRILSLPFVKWDSLRVEPLP